LGEHSTRRSFLQSTAAAGIAAVAAASPVAKGADAAKLATTAATAPSTTQAKKLNIGIVGVGGRGFDHVREINALPSANVIAICDVDVTFMVNAARVIKDAKPFVDFRDMLKMPELEAVVVATPDHTHAAITAAALRAGKHVYCEKPLTHTVREGRAITDLAQQTRLVTQLGIQIHAMDNYRRVVEWIQSGAIGPVREVHIWNNRGHHALDDAQVAPPASLNYELWLGPVPPRAYHAGFHPFNWRRYWAFGEGMLGDIGCHLMDVAFWALDLKYPTRISAEGGGGSEELCSEWNIAKYEFPARSANQPAVTMTWYDANKPPPMLASWKLDPKFTEGVMFIGESGMLFTDYGSHRLLPEEKFKDAKPPAQRFAKSPGHQAEWVAACLVNDPTATSTPFSYGGPLSETALLGMVAYRAGKPLDWDAANLKFTNAPEAEKHLGYEYREGWTL
jgi:predicted dehydrogenase